MSAFVTSLLFAAGVAAWVWSKVSRQTGSADPKSVTMVAGGVGLAAFIVFFTLMKYVMHLS